MKPFPRLFVFPVFILLLATVLTAEEAEPLAPYQPPANSTQTLRLWGSRNMDALVHAWAQAYRVAHPEVNFEIKLLGNGTAMPALYLGLADLAFFSRDLIVTDVDGFAHVRKYNPLRVELATGSAEDPGHAPALVLLVHRDNPLTRLSLRQVDAIFSAPRRRGASAAIRTWGQLGLTGEWTDQPIHLYGDDAQSMTALFFQRAALGNSHRMNWEHFTEFGDLRRADGTVVTAAQQTSAALKTDRYGLAISSLHYLTKELKPLALAEKDSGLFYEPTKVNIAARRYPLSRPVFVCADQPPGRPLDPKVRDFLYFVLGAAGQQMIVRDGSYLPLTTEAAREELSKLP